MQKDETKPPQQQAQHAQKLISFQTFSSPELRKHFQISLIALVSAVHRYQRSLGADTNDSWPVRPVSVRGSQLFPKDIGAISLCIAQGCVVPVHNVAIDNCLCSTSLFGAQKRVESCFERCRHIHICRCPRGFLRTSALQRKFVTEMSCFLYQFQPNSGYAERCRSDREVP